MKHKKAMSGLMWTLVVFVLALVALGVLLFVVVKPIPELGRSATAMSPSIDNLCLTRSRLYTDGTDVDKDGREDYLCDSCVCGSNDCNNNIISKKGSDNDGDGLPAICDEDDTDKTKHGFNAKNCNSTKLIELGTPWGKQCRPKQITT